MDIIEQVNRIYSREFDSYGRGIDRAIQAIRAAGITDETETCEILRASHYSQETAGTVTSLVMSIGEG